MSIRRIECVPMIERRVFLRSIIGAGVAATCFRMAPASDRSDRADFLVEVRESALAGLRRLASPGWHGFHPAVNRPAAEFNILREAGMHAALSRGARTFGPEIMADTVEGSSLRANLSKFFDEHFSMPADGSAYACPRTRYEDAHPVGLAGLTLLAMEELEEKSAREFATRAELVARYLHQRQRPEGTFRLGPSEDPSDDEGEDDLDCVAYYPGEALYALARGNRIRREAWREEVLERAFAPYREHWRRYRQQAFIPWQSCAYAEGFLQTKRPEYAEFVFEMNDWLLGAQYTADGRSPEDWVGGFDTVWEGERFGAVPGASTGSYAESLVDALRVAVATGDGAREARYRSALESSLRFLMSIQYTESNTGHFAPAFRERLIGAFYASVENGMVRIDFTQHALMAMCQYLDSVETKLS